jgi:predicted AlkP superfamily pyrophosphatase or phosphodiesterase
MVSLPRRTLLVFAVLLGACARVQSSREPSLVQQSAYRPARGRVTDHVIVVSIDGLRPDAIAKYRAPTLQRLMREGRYSLSAQTIGISKTLPSHTSMITGVDSDQHGVTWNTDRTSETGTVKVPTIFGIAHDAGFSTAAFFSKTKFNHLAAPGTIDHFRGPKSGMFPWNSGKTVGNVRHHFATATPNLTFVHLADADFAGHSFGWMGHMYGMAVRQADSSLARLIELADAKFGVGRYSVIVTADHGGHGRTHGSTDKRDTTIPWIVWGAGVQRGDTLTGIRTMDTAATVLWMLGLDAPPAWTGRSLASAFARN